MISDEETLTPFGLTTTRAVGSQTIDAVLDTQPLVNVMVCFGISGREALLADTVDESHVNIETSRSNVVSK